MRREGLRLKEAQVGEALPEQQVVEQGTCLCHHSFRVVGKLTGGFEEHLVDKGAVIEQVVSVWEP